MVSEINAMVADVFTLDSTHYDTPLAQSLPSNLGIFMQSGKIKTEQLYSGRLSTGKRTIPTSIQSDQQVTVAD